MSPTKESSIRGTLVVDSRKWRILNSFEAGKMRSGSSDDDFLYVFIMRMFQVFLQLYVKRWLHACIRVSYQFMHFLCRVIRLLCTTNNVYIRNFLFLIINFNVMWAFVCKATHSFFKDLCLMITIFFSSVLFENLYSFATKPLI